MPFSKLNEDPEYDDDTTWQELEDLEEDQFFEQIEVPVDVSDVYYGA